MKLTMHKPSMPMAQHQVRSLKANTNSLRGTSRSRWGVLRTSILWRDGGLCQECARHNWPRQADEVDHIAGLQFGGDDNPDNLQSLCRPCHKRKTTEEVGATYRPPQRIGVDGFPIEDKT